MTVAMAKQGKLKVYRTPIGFHDAYVATACMLGGSLLLASPVGRHAGYAAQVEKPATAGMERASLR